MFRDLSHTSQLLSRDEVDRRPANTAARTKRCARQKVFGDAFVRVVSRYRIERAKFARSCSRLTYENQVEKPNRKSRLGKIWRTHSNWESICRNRDDSIARNMSGRIYGVLHSCCAKLPIHSGMCTIWAHAQMDRKVGAAQDCASRLTGERGSPLSLIVRSRSKRMVRWELKHLTWRLIVFRCPRPLLSRPCNSLRLLPLWPRKRLSLAS